LAEFDLEGTRILIARAAVARDLLPVELERRGATVDVVEAYRTVPPANLAENAANILARKPDWITFTSSSTVHNLVDAVGASRLHGFRCASIGPVTTATLRQYGLNAAAEAGVYTIPGLAEALLASRKL
jgi:uroporphyrinogen-III synthase